MSPSPSKLNRDPSKERVIIPSFRPNPVKASYSPIRRAPVQHAIVVGKSGSIKPHPPAKHTPPKSYKKPKVVPVILPKRKIKKVRFSEIPDSRIGPVGTSGNGKQIGGTNLDKGAFWNSGQSAGSIDIGDSKHNKFIIHHSNLE
jgi:hypothetical protein